VVKLTLVGGPTALLEYAGLRWLTDPTFSPPGEYAGGLLKTAGPAIESAALAPIDVVLLSHEHHSDNLDPAGREFLPTAARVLTTSEGAEKLGGNATGVDPWSSVEIERQQEAPVRVTAVPAQHGPKGSETITGPVIGFVLEAAGAPNVYVSGDNASLEVVREIVDRLGPVEVAVLFAGAVQLPHRFDGAYLTLSSDHAAQAAMLLGARTVIPVHFDGWAHFGQGADELRKAFAGNGIAERLALAGPGQSVTA
jgi:L-ascorbate metabolism protein UlaG (beta-lactamase superfamily)